MILNTNEKYKFTAYGAIASILEWFNFDWKKNKEERKKSNSNVYKRIFFNSLYFI